MKRYSACLCFCRYSKVRDAEDESFFVLKLCVPKLDYMVYIHGRRKAPFKGLSACYLYLLRANASLEKNMFWKDANSARYVGFLYTESRFLSLSRYVQYPAMHCSIIRLLNRYIKQEFCKRDSFSSSYNNYK